MKRKLIPLVLLLGSFLAVTRLGPAHADQVEPCRTYLNNGGRYFDTYEQHEYRNGFLAMHFKLVAGHMDGRSWFDEIFLHRPDCSTTIFKHAGDNLIENFRSGIQYFSLRFSSETHFQLWDDEQDIPIDCQYCSGDLPTDVQYSTISYGGTIDAGASLFHSGSYAVKENPDLSRKPLIIVPGILGTEMDLKGETVWPNVGKIAADTDDTFLDALNIYPFGQPEEPELMIGPVLPDIDYAFGKYHYADLLIQELESRGYVRDKDLFLFPYDWRQSVSQTAQKLSSKIDEILASTGAGKVDVVAHSLGGLVVKKYISDSGTPKINRAVFVGIPNLGSPQAAKNLIFGDNFGIPLLSAQEIGKLSQNMPSVYELLPSVEYYKHFPGFYADLAKNGNILDYAGSKDFLLGLGKNKNLIDQAEALHSAAFDNLDLSAMGIQAYNLVGCGTFTIQTINKYYSGDSGYLKQLYNPKYRIVSGSGDGTVPVGSADYLKGARTYYLKNSEHSKMLSADGNRQLIADLLTSGNSASTGVNKSECAVQGRLISMPSSLEVTIKDPITNAVLNESTGVISNRLGNDVLIFIPDGQAYAISAKPTKKEAVNVNIKNYTTNKTYYYDNIKIDQKLEMDITPGSADQIANVDDMGAAQPVTPSYQSADDQPMDVSAPSSALKDYAGNSYRNGSQLSLSMNERRISFVADDSGAGVLDINFSFDQGDTWSVYSSGFVSVPIDAQSIIFFSEDKAGNAEPIQNVAVQWSYPQSTVIYSAGLPADNLQDTAGVAQDASEGAQGADDTTTEDAGNDPNVESDPNIDLQQSENQTQPIIIPVSGPSGGSQPANIYLSINIPREAYQPAVLRAEGARGSDLVLSGIYKFFGFLAHLIFF